jgi:hypothetical protein
MYSFELNIGDWGTPVVGGGWVEANPIWNKCNINKSTEPDTFRTSTKVNGLLTFNGNEAVILKALSVDNLYISLRIIYDGDEIWQGELQLLGKFNMEKKQCDLETSVSATLYQKIKTGMELKWPDVNETVSPATVNFTFTTWLDQIGQAFEKGQTGANIVPDNYNVTENAMTAFQTWDDETEYGVASYLDNYLWQGHYRTIPERYPVIPISFVTKNSKYYVCILADNIGKDPETETTYWKEIELSASDCIYYSQERSYFQNYDEYFAFDSNLNLWFRAGSGVNGTYDNLVTQCQSVFNILEKLLLRVDPLIEIYEVTAAENTGFIPYLETYYSTGHLIYHWASLDEVTEISLSDIIGFIQTCFNVTWKLEGNIFVFRHASEIPITVGSSDAYKLMTYLGKDWTVWDEDDSQADKICKERLTFGNSNARIDFYDQEIDYNNYYETTKDISTNFNTDFVDIFNNDLDGILMCHHELGYLVLSQKDGLINAHDKFNGYLSTSNCFADHYIFGRPFTKGTLKSNETEYTFTRKRNIEINLKVPYFVPDIIDIENYLVETSNGDLEVRELIIKMSDGIAEIKGVKAGRS